MLGIDRISALAQELVRLGIDIQNCLTVCRSWALLTARAEVQSFGDHRMAMALAAAGLFSPEPVKVQGSECISVSFPGVAQLLAKIVKY